MVKCTSSAEGETIHKNAAATNKHVLSLHTFEEPGFLIQLHKPHHTPRNYLVRFRSCPAPPRFDLHYHELVVRVAGCGRQQELTGAVEEIDDYGKDRLSAPAPHTPRGHLQSIQASDHSPSEKRSCLVATPPREHKRNAKARTQAQTQRKGTHAPE